MADLRDGVYVWVTWVSKIMAGEQSCEWASWFKSHHQYKKLPSDFNQAAWTIDHTRRLRELQIERRKCGDQVTVESENAIRYQASAAITLAGKPDLIGRNGLTVTIFDVKTGQPKTSDVIQVMIYMYLVPLLIPRYKDTSPRGFVVYGDNRTEIPAEAIDQRFKDNFQYFLTVVSGTDAPGKVPSEHECRFCDIPRSECSERHEEDALVAINQT